MSDRQPLVAGNWKLNGSRDSVAALASAVVDGIDSDAVEVVLCPVAVHLADVAGKLQGSSLRLGAQNCAAEVSGAFTGEVAAPMLAEYGVQYVIAGHSERRSLYGETNTVVAAKVEAILDAGLSPILCIGETLEERQAGNMQAVVQGQLDAVLERVGIARFERIVIAYEPVWAIGTGETATPAQAQEVHALIRARLAAADNSVAHGVRILYGGSVKPDNAASLFGCEDIDGGLIGGAALDAESFLTICRAA